jgi:hypothetical protein
MSAFGGKADIDRTGKAEVPALRPAYLLLAEANLNALPVFIIFGNRTAKR